MSLCHVWDFVREQQHLTIRCQHSRLQRWSTHTAERQDLRVNSHAYPLGLALQVRPTEDLILSLLAEFVKYLDDARHDPEKRRQKKLAMNTLMYLPHGALAI